MAFPSSSSRRSQLSEMTSNHSQGLRAGDVASLQAELRRRDVGEMQPQSRRRSSNHSQNTSSAIHSNSRPAVFDRQLSSGQLSTERERRKPRSRRAASNASRTSTVLSLNQSRETKYKDGNQASRSASLTSPATPLSGNKAGEAFHDSPLRRWCRFLEKISSRTSVSSQSSSLRTREWLIALAVIVWIKWAVGLGGWSGKGYPPLYGDMEAQRHWLSLVSHLPPSQWYFHNLKHWGLDYPPLTAYHSWLLARIARATGNRQVAELRGRLGGREVVHGEEKAVLFMRSTVIGGDILLWAIPVALWCAHALGRWRQSDGGSSKRSSRTMMISFYTIMLQPGLIMIDSGHFQYNSIMLGLTLCGVISMHRGRDSLGAFFFVLSMCFKQMAIYYAPAIFAYLLAKCFWLGGAEGLNLFTSLGSVSVITLLVLFAPFLSSSTQLFQALHRIFPFSRGLFEDKVANVWCSLNVVIKLRELVATPTLARASGLLTITAVSPLIVGMVWVGIQLRRGDPEHELRTFKLGSATRVPAPFVKLLPHALFASAMAFFLFSFQVHEKTILLPLMPLTLLLVGSLPGLPGQDFEWTVLLNNVGSFSMYPLLKRDRLALPTIALTLFWNFSIGYNPLSLRPSFVKYLSSAIYFGAFLLLFLETFTVPPAHLPDLFVVLNVLLSCGVFGLGWLWGLKRLLEESWGLIGLGATAPVSSARSESVYSPPLQQNGRSRFLSPSDTEFTLGVRSPTQADIVRHDAAYAQQSQPLRRSSSIASSSRTATRRSQRSPLLSSQEVMEGENADSVAYNSRIAENRHSTSDLFSSGLSPGSGNISTQVSPSKTAVPTSRQRSFDRGTEEDGARYRKSTIAEFL